MQDCSLNSPVLRPTRVCFVLLVAVLFTQATPAQTSHDSSNSSLLLNNTPANAAVPGSAAVATADDNYMNMTPRLGFNAALIYNSTHDSAANWADSATPYISYTFTKNYSVDLSCPIYILRYAANTETVPKPGSTLAPIPLRGETGDTLLSGHAAFSNHYFDYMATLSVTAPSGDTLYGLSTGRATFDLTHDISHTYGHFAPGVEIGVGDSSSLVDAKIVQDYISLGPLAHFQLGSTIDLPLQMLFEADAYEELPIGDQKIYSTVVLRHQTTTEVTGTTLPEDNGFTTELDIPLGNQVILSGFYNRSRRFGVDTAGVSLTFLLRDPLMPAKDSVEQKQIDSLIK